MPGLGLFFLLVESGATCSYYLLLLSFINQIVFMVYGLYLDLLLTRVYVDVLRTNEEKAICAWSEEAKSCVSPESRFSYIAIVSSTSKPQRIWAPSQYRWAFGCPKTHSCLFRPHDKGWFPASLMVRSQSRAYHKATLAWGGRLLFKSDFTTLDYVRASSQSID